MISDTNNSLKLFISLLCVYSLRKVHANDCDDGWHQYRNKCYNIHFQSVTYAEYNDRCRQLDAELISVHSSEELKFLTAFIPENMFWMGAQRNQSDTNSFIWTDNSEWNYERWAYLHPLNDGDCVCVVDGVFITCDCDSDAIPICQKWTKMHTVSAMFEDFENKVSKNLQNIEENIENRLKSLSDEFEIQFNTLYILMSQMLSEESSQNIDKSKNVVCTDKNCVTETSIANSEKRNIEDNKTRPMAESLRLLPKSRNRNNISNSEFNESSSTQSNDKLDSETSQLFEFPSISSVDEKLNSTELFTNFPMLNDSSVSEETETEIINSSGDSGFLEKDYDSNRSNSDELTTITEATTGSEYLVFVDSSGELKPWQQNFDENSSVIEVNTTSDKEVTTDTLSSSPFTTETQFDFSFSNENLTVDISNENNETIEASTHNNTHSFANKHEMNSTFAEMKLGELKTQKVPSYGDWNLKLEQKQPNLVTFNYKLPAGVTAGVYGRRDRVPSYTKYDFMRVIGSSSLFSRKTRSNRESSEKQIVEFTQYLDPGNWYITVYNDESQPQEISFVTVVTNNSKVDCLNGCSGHGVCVNGTCECEKDYVGSKCEFKTCPILCSNNGKYVKGQCLCDNGWTGMECEKRANDCNDCNGNGNCVNEFCECFDGYTGKQCEEEIYCSQNCSGNGICVKGLCNCFHGFEGEHCETEIDACNLSCGINGHCENGQCICSTGWTGLTCNQRLCESRCSVRGICNNGTCICPQGWSGTNCDQLLCDSRCTKHGVCNNGTCHCPQGWNGKHCSLEGCPRNCSSRGECQQIDDEWSCDCFSGWTGKGCTIPLELQCDDGFDNDYDGLVDCADSECCETNACTNSPLCFASLEPGDVLLRKHSPSVTASFFKKVQFLVEENSVQKYASWESFVESRASVIRGRVQNQYGYGLRGVRVGVDNEPFFGITVTRSKGWFDILVNGGGAVTLYFQREPFHPLHITVQVPWNEFVVIDKIVMHIDKHKLLKQTPEICVEHDYQHMRPRVVNDWKDRLRNTCNKRGQLSKLMSPVLLDTIPISRSNIALVYKSSRSQKFLSTLELQLTPNEVPSALTKVYLKIAIKGKLFQKTFEGNANITFTFVWNRRNVYNQKVYGTATATIHVGYEYTECSEIIWEVRSVQMNGYDINISEVGEWNINIHHKLNVNNWIVHKGDGSNLYLNNRPKRVKVIMGYGEQRAIHCPHCNGIAEYQSLLQPIAIASGPDGSLYVGDFNLIRRITKDGQVTTVVELTSAQLAYKYYLMVSPVDGKLYISDPEKYQILRSVTLTEPNLNPRMNLEVVVGCGLKCLPGNRQRCGDGRQARDARLAYPKGIAINLQNEMFIADAANIRMVDSNGIIYTLIGDNFHKLLWRPFPCFKAIPLHEMVFRWPTELAINPIDNSLHILDDNIIWRVTRDKRMQIVAGRQAHCSISNVSKTRLATQAFLESPRSIAFATNGNLFIAESDSHTINRIRKVTADGEITRVAGVDLDCSCMQMNCDCFGEENSLALQAKFNTISSITVTEDGLLHVCDQGNLRVRTVLTSSTYFNENQEYEVIDNKNIYIFNRFGLHVATKSKANGQLKYQFAYTDKTSAGKLILITDAKHNKIYLLRDRQKQAISIEGSSFGHCKLLFNKNRQLKSLEAPNMKKVVLNYYENSGLLKSRGDLNNESAIIYNFDENGRFLDAITTNGVQVKLNVSSTYEKLCEEIADESNASISTVNS